MAILPSLPRYACERVLVQQPPVRGMKDLYTSMDILRQASYAYDYVESVRCIVIESTSHGALYNQFPV
jgi:hypothetical protein